MRFLFALTLATTLLSASSHSAQAQTEIAEPKTIPAAELVVPTQYYAATSLPAAAPDELATEPTTEPATTEPLALQLLSPAQREELGRQDARRDYKPAKGTFWAGVGGGLTAPAGAGVVATTALLATAPSAARMQTTATRPDLLQDADYRRGYAQVAKQKRTSRVLLGTGVGAAAAVVTWITIVVPALGASL